MFTDMVGYTALMHADERVALDKRDRYMSALASHHDAFGGTMGQLLIALESGEPPAISARDNLKTMALVDAAYQSAELKRAVKLSEITG